MTPTALICLDDPPLAFAVVDRFRSVGWRVARGVGEAPRLQPDLVVLDARADGLIEALKTDPRTSRLTVVAIGDAELRNRCLQLGALACLPWPIDLTAFDAITDFIAHGASRGAEVDAVEAGRLGAVAPLAG